MLDLETLAGTDLTTFVASLYNALPSRIAKLTRGTTQQSIANNTVTPITWATLTQSSSIATALWTSGDNTKLLIPSELNGRIGIFVHRSYWAAITGRRDAKVFKNGADIGFHMHGNSGAAHEGTATFPSDPKVLTTGDYYQATVYQNSGGAVNYGNAGSSTDVSFSLYVF